MFIPISDDNTLKSIKFQWVTLSLIALNVAVFAFSSADIPLSLIASFALVPVELFHVNILGGAFPGQTQSVAVPEGTTLLTYMFIHGDIFHLVGNMLFLFVFGDNVEDAMGHIKFLAFYLLCGVIAGLTHAMMVPDSTLPLVGASGAVAGVIAAYLMLHPRVRVWILAFKFIPLQINAAIALGFWVATQVVMVMLPQTGPVAWWAHIGGLAAGAFLVLFFRRPGVVLFDRNLKVV